MIFYVTWLWDGQTYHFWLKNWERCLHWMQFLCLVIFVLNPVSYCTFWSMGFHKSTMPAIVQFPHHFCVDKHKDNLFSPPPPKCWPYQWREILLSMWCHGGVDRTLVESFLGGSLGGGGAEEIISWMKSKNAYFTFQCFNGWRGLNMCQKNF